MEGNATGSWLSVVLALAPIAIKGVDLLIDHIKDKKNEDEKNERQRIEEQMDLKIKELQEQNELNEEIYIYMQNKYAIIEKEILYLKLILIFFI